MAFEVFDNRPFRQVTPALTLDKYNRLYLNLLTQQLFGFDKEQGPYFLYVWYDKVNRRIGLAKPDIVKLVDTRPFKFDKRFYTSFKKLVEYYRIDTNTTKRYIYESLTVTFDSLFKQVNHFFYRPHVTNGKMYWVAI